MRTCPLLGHVKLDYVKGGDIGSDMHPYFLGFKQDSYDEVFRTPH